MTTAAHRKIVAGAQFGSTTATLGQVTDSGGAVVAGGGLPVTGEVRLVALGLAPSYFTTVEVDGNQMRELVQHLPPGTTVNSGNLENGGALQIATLLNASHELTKLALLLGAVAFWPSVLLAIGLGWLVARTALVPLNSLTDAVEDVAETTDVSRRLDPGGADRARPPPPDLQPPCSGRWSRRRRAQEAQLVLERVALVLDPAHQPAHQSRGDPPTSTSSAPRTVPCWSTTCSCSFGSSPASWPTWPSWRRERPAPGPPELLRLDLLVRAGHPAVQETHGRADGDHLRSPARSRAGSTATRIA